MYCALAPRGISGSSSEGATFQPLVLLLMMLPAEVEINGPMPGRLLIKVSLVGMVMV